jgi:hypothetical protein
MAGYGRFITIELGPSVYLERTSEKAVGMDGMNGLFFWRVMVEVWELLLNKLKRRCEKCFF